jgi:hypothetical protein
MRMNLRTYSLLAVLVPLAVFCLTISSGGGQERGFVDLQASIVQNHALSIPRNGTDTIQYEGNNYVVYAPGYAFISLPIVELGLILGGPNAQFPVYANFTGELFLAVAASVSSLLLYKISLFYTKSRSAALLAAFTLAFGTSVWPFAVEIYPHDLSMLFSLLSVYLVLVYCKATIRPSWLLGMAGLALGLATFVEYAAGLFVFPLFVYLVLRGKRGEGRSILSTLFGAETISFPAAFVVAGFGTNFLYNYAIFRNPFLFPQQEYVKGLHFYLGDLAAHILFYLASPYRGILFFSPVLILGFYGLYRMSKTTSVRSDSILFLSLFCLIWIFYSAWQDWDGGFSYGPRFLILGLPFLVIPVSVFLSENRSRIWRSVFLALFILSSLIEGIGAISGSSPPSTTDVLTYLPVTYNLPLILQGRFDVWWVQWFGIWGLQTVVISLASVFVFIWFVSSWLCFANLPNYSRVTSRSKTESPIVQ